MSLTSDFYTVEFPVEIQHRSKRSSVLFFTFPLLVMAIGVFYHNLSRGNPGYFGIVLRRFYSPGDSRELGFYQIKGAGVVKTGVFSLFLMALVTAFFCSPFTPSS